MRREFPCGICGSPVVSYRADGRYCSMACAAQGRRGTRNCNYNGGLSTWQGRTVVVCRNGGWILYSRALMAGHVGRLLRSNEIVHHINEDSSDDRIENLTIVSRREHAALHRAELNASRRAAFAAKAAA
jgi:hypothetical protein